MAESDDTEHLARLICEALRKPEVLEHVRQTVGRLCTFHPRTAYASNGRIVQCTSELEFEHGKRVRLIVEEDLNHEQTRRILEENR